VKQIRKRLTYANVMSSIAVFLILGGATAFAATKIGSGQLKANSVLTGKIKKEAVTAGKIKAGAITNSRLANDAVTGAKVLDGSLTSADLVAGTLTPACPSGTVLAEGVCFELTPRAAATFNDSVDTCTSLGRRLPSVNELIGFTRKVQTIPAPERSGDLYTPTVAFSVEPNGTPSVAVLFTTAQVYRCVGVPTP